MDSKLLILFRFVVYCSWVHLGFSRDLSQQGGLGLEEPPSCVNSLLPCKPYLKSNAPPSSCCAPLKEMLTKDVACLCNLFNNLEVLKSFNLTQDEALHLPKACGAVFDVSTCKTASSPAPSSGPPSNSNSSGTPSSNSASVATHGGMPRISKFGLICSLVALCFSSF
ncbi:non-specific lipid transfer protein GPI-anchored 9 [Mangifera indica]|uniref:non-specific lipid transfer protein GPI-anchored 9 n=1 Tax=Mangifera indica TaxID=29780 RepID=UPI001CF9F683|nr:non-specific lipid transfer protein GPI-anchored 9 [Mangifera indica]